MAVRRNDPQMRTQLVVGDNFDEAISEHDVRVLPGNLLNNVKGHYENAIYCH